MADNREGANRGRLYIISAPSGAGKTSLVRALLTTEHNLVVSVSYTTRPMRPGEQQGVDYHFVDDATFRELIKAGEFLEYAEVFDHCYGTSRSRVNEQLNKGKDVILEIDWQGAQQVRRTMPENTTIFILPPSREALERRLRNRQQDSEQVIARRLRDAMTEISHYDEFDYVLVNDDFEATINELRGLLKSPHKGKKALSDNVIKVLDGLLNP